MIFVGKTTFSADQSSSGLGSCQGLSCYDSATNPTQMLDATKATTKYHVQLENNSKYYVTLASKKQRSVVVEFNRNNKREIVVEQRPCESISISRGKTTFSTQYSDVTLNVVELGVTDKVLCGAPFWLKHHTKISIDSVDPKIENGVGPKIENGVGPKIEVRCLEIRSGSSSCK